MRQGNTPEVAFVVTGRSGEAETEANPIHRDKFKPWLPNGSDGSCIAAIS